jgi:hypothetical protein
MKTYPIPDALADKYHGCGWALAAVTGGKVIDLVYMRDAVADFDEERPLATVLQSIALAPTVRQLSALGEVVVGMCSCWEFCEQ